MLDFLYRTNRYSTDKGFTLLELVAVVAIAGILAAIAAPSWLGSLARQRVNAAQSLAFSKVKATQSFAKTVRQEMQVSFRVNPTNGALEYAIHTVRGTNFASPDSFGLNCQFNFASGTGTTRTGGCETWTPLLPDRAVAAQLSLWVSKFGTPVNTSGPQRITCIKFKPDGTINMRGGCVSANNQYFVFATRQGSKLRCFRLDSQIAQITLFKEGQQACKIDDQKVQL